MVTLDLSDKDLHAAIYSLSAVQRARAHAGRPVPRQITALRQRLETARRCGVARTRHENEGGPAESEWIGSQLAAKVLGWSQRTTQRRATDLDARLIGGRLAFPARAVHEYAKQIGRQRLN